MRKTTSNNSQRSPHTLLLVLAATATIAGLCCFSTAGAAISSITFKNQCAHTINVFEGDERFCDVRAGSAAAPTFGCATNLPLGFAIYSHTGGRNATSKCFMAPFAHAGRIFLSVVMKQTLDA